MAIILASKALSPRCLSYKVFDCCSADGKHQLPQQDKQLQETSNYQAQDDLSEVLAIFLHIPEEKAERLLLFDVLFAIHLIREESRGCFQEHGYTFVLAIRFRAYPMSLELF